MKMRTVIEAGREASPIINGNLSALTEQVLSCRQLLSDLIAVKSDAGRTAMIQQCVKGMYDLTHAIEEVNGAWSKLDCTIGEYKYKFNRSKKRQVRDLPGQQVLFDESA